MSSIAVKNVIQYEQMRDKYRRYNLRRNTNFLALATREITRLPSEIPVIEEGRGVVYKPTIEELENITVEILVPKLSRQSKKRITEEIEEQGMDLKFDYISREELKKYLALDEVFAVPSKGKVARITVSGLPIDYKKACDIAARADIILGVPTYLAEKQNSY
jgi:hypothetical protein